MFTDVIQNNIKIYKIYMNDKNIYQLKYNI